MDITITKKVLISLTGDELKTMRCALHIYTASTGITGDAKSCAKKMLNSIELSD